MKLILIFMSITKKKLKVDKNEHEYILFRTDAYFIEYFLPYKFMIKTTKVEKVFLKKKRQEPLQEKKLGCKFIRINTSNAEKGYDTDYEVSKIQTFISKFKKEK